MQFQTQMVRAATHPHSFRPCVHLSVLASFRPCARPCVSPSFRPSVRASVLASSRPVVRTCVRPCFLAFVRCAWPRPLFCSCARPLRARSTQQCVRSKSACPRPLFASCARPLFLCLCGRARAPYNNALVPRAPSFYQLYHSLGFCDVSDVTVRNSSVHSCHQLDLAIHMIHEICVF